MKQSGIVSERGVEGRLDGRWQTGWSRFVWRWALAAAVVEVALLVVAIVWFVPASEAGGAGAELGELVAAVASPGMYRLLAVLDVLVWVALGGLFIGLAAVMAERAPRRSVLLAVCGVGQVTGVAGAFVRMQAVGGAAARHGSAGLEDPIVVESFLGVQDVLFALMNTGALLWALAFAVAATVAWQSRRFARWLAVLLGVLGIVALADVALYMVGGQFLLDVVKFLLLPVVFVSIAIAFRPLRDDRGALSSVIRPGAARARRRARWEGRDIPEAMFDALGAAMALSGPANASMGPETFRWGTPHAHIPVTDDELAGCQVPVQFIWGQNDRVQHPQAARRAAELLPDARVEILTGGHGIWFDVPDRCCQLLTEFLRNIEQKAPS